MDIIASPLTLHGYNTYNKYRESLRLICPPWIHPTLHITNRSSLFNEVDPSTLAAGYSSWSMQYINASEKTLIKSMLLFALVRTALTRYKDPSNIFWKTFSLEYLPIAASYYLPALVVKQGFYLAKGRSFVDHTDQNERVAYVVMTVAFSVFVMPRVIAKIQGKTAPISHLGLAKYYAIQCVWHLTINECLAKTGEAMREDIKSNPEKWLSYHLNPDYNMAEPGYHLNQTLMKALKVDHLPQEADVPLAHFYLNMSPYVPEVESQTPTTFQTLKQRVEQKYPFLFYTKEKVENLKVEDVNVNEGEESLWSCFKNMHHYNLSQDVNDHLTWTIFCNNLRRLFS